MTPGLETDNGDGDDQRADRVAFSELFDRGFADVWGYVRRRVASGQDADDLTAEVFAVAWRRRHQLPAPEERRPWLFGVARNVLRNHQRATFRQRRLVGRLAGLAEANGAGAGDVDRDDALWRALSRLTEDDREILLMRAWDRLPVGEIATILDCSPNAASLRLNKARARLRTALGEKDQKPGGHEVLNPARRGERDDNPSR